MAAGISVCPGVDSASKSEYQDIPGGKGGRYVRVTTLPPSFVECLVIWSLNLPEPSGPHRGLLINISYFPVHAKFFTVHLRVMNNKVSIFVRLDVWELEVS